MKDLIFLVDFDRTITMNDSTDELMNQYNPQMVEEYQKSFRRGDLRVREYIKGLLESLKITKDEYKEAVTKNLIIDPDFKKFIELGYEMRIVSAGTYENILPNFEKEGKFSINDEKQLMIKELRSLNACSKKGLVEMFDSSIGAGSVLMPYGGKYQLTETQSMVAKVPVQNGKTDTVTMMSYGFDPYLSSWSPYHGAVYAVTESMAKIVACGGDYSKIRLDRKSVV